MKNTLIYLFLFCFVNVLFAQPCDSDLEATHTAVPSSGEDCLNTWNYQWTFFEDVELVKFSIVGCTSCDYETDADNGEIEFYLDTTCTVTLCIAITGIDFDGNVFCVDTICYLPPTLPIETGYYDVSERNGEAIVTVEVLSEFNNDRLELHYSNGDPTEMQIISSLPGQGDSNIRSTYLFTAPYQPGDNYYQVRQVDRDGEYEWLKLLVLTKKRTFKYYPVPVGDQLTVETENEIYLVDMTGYPSKGWFPMEIEGETVLLLRHD